MNDEGIKFLNRLYQDLHLKEEVMHTALKSDDKIKKVRRYLERLERVNNKAIKYDSIELLKELYHTKYVIKRENVPESYFELQKRLAFDRGFGKVEITEDIKEAGIETIIKDQKYSLDIWLDYFLSPDTNQYPMWFKYYAFQGMLRLGEYDKEKEKFKKRTEYTTVKFIDLNREALSYTYDAIVNTLKKEKIDDEDLEKLANNGNFEKIYTYFIKLLDNQKKNITNSEGIWKVFKRGSDPSILVGTLEGRGTGWCTAGIETARSQLAGGDFHIYYTKDENGDYNQPRIAIRMEDNKIGEIRGIAAHQNLEPEMQNVLEEKLKEFPDKDDYLKKVSDMEKLTIIYKEKDAKELSIEELRFLYEIDDKINGFGYQKDPRINEILDDRNFKEDLSKVFNCSEDEISDNPVDVLTGKKIVYFYGSLNLDGFRSAEGLVLPEYIGDSLYLNGLTSAEGLKLPKQIGNYLGLYSLTSAEGLKLPEYIGTSLDLSGLTSAEGLKLPEHIGGYLDLRSLTSLDGIIFPDNFELKGKLYSNYFTKEDLLKAAQEQRENRTKEGRGL